MSRIRFLLFSLCMIFCWLLWSHMTDSGSSSYKVEEGDLEGTGNSQVRDFVSENDESKNDKMNWDLKHFYHLEDTICENSKKKYENLVKTVDNYIQRYISLFLITSNLLNYQIKDLQEDIIIDLEITIRGEDLAYLQGYSKAGREATYLKNLSKLDTIFSKIARLKKQSYMETAFKYSKSVFINLFLKVLNLPSFNHYLCLLIIFLVTWCSYTFSFYKHYEVIGIILNSMILWDSLILYWKRIKEMDVEIYVKALQFKQPPEDCDPSNISWYQRLYSIVVQNRCLQYYQNINKNPIEEVSILRCIFDTYSFYLIQAPVKILGASIKDFTGEICDLWPWPLRYIVSVPLAPFFAVVTLFFILILCGKRIRLSFLSATLELGDVKPSTGWLKAAPSIDSASQGDVVRDVRKLRPWTNVRFPKRLDRDFATRRRLLLKTVKSFPDIPDSIIKTPVDFKEKLISQETNVTPDVNIIKQD